ncbi:AMID-like mitochondrial oxidoreductase, putative [Trichophyton verrucosum HKI 0517]|uniref:AMID-like mitochondrial oxidoreductase, putative n=1 Tax=Trichophyton verrucosum (strain HKI 0517) TaxID=663202 RepID=D4D580_TRIVH|nr:AMID-like mitochondrial oxidoreductase, putative [Trichophyton verrucosum HKI 0517]EFE43000.1 AMID-like mitochondrial oxidoreductase, putative [Trichophyton verrucosum HKI 0517]
MVLQRFKLMLVYIRHLIPITWTLLSEKAKGLFHKLTYRTTESCKNVVIIGGSFSGLYLAQKLIQSLPTGHRVVLIDKNSHFNYTFNFPRYSVLQGHEHLAFIPYDGIAKDAPVGIYQHVRGLVTSVTRDTVTLETGEIIPYTYLAFATGATQKPSAGLLATEAQEGCTELRDRQKSIMEAKNIAVIGGGAVGVELATDIKSYYPEKSVTLIHSRERLLPRFGGQLHENVMDALQKLNIEVRLGERPKLRFRNEKGESEQEKDQSLLFSDGKVVAYDLIVPCTGHRPNSDLVANLEPDAISKSTGRILTQPTLQIVSKDGQNPRVFALGDVAETEGTLMARSAYFQARVVGENILSMIRGSDPKAKYVPNLAIEGALKLTVGKSDWLMYVKPADSDAIIDSGNNGNEDLDIHVAWKHFGGDIKNANSLAEKLSSVQ